MLPPTTILYPGHDYRGLSSTSVAEEKNYNPRLGGEVSEEDFSGFMNNLGLAYPARIDVAVPANLMCGKPPEGIDVHDLDTAWGPLRYTFAGFWEIEAKWLQQNLGSVQIVDVRDVAEFDGPLGHIEGAVLLPLDRLECETQSLSTEVPIILVCRSGSKSARATLMLRNLGFKQVANLAGGMLRWHALTNWSDWSI